MSLAAAPIVGSSRVVVLAPEESAPVRGTAAEYRRFGVTLVRRSDILAALTEAVHDRSSVLVVACDIPCPDLRGVVEVAVAACEGPVLLGVGAGATIEDVAAALRAGARGTIMLPLSPERLCQALASLPAAEEPEPIVVGHLSVDAVRHNVRWAGTLLAVTPRELSLLDRLARAHPALVTLADLAADLPGAQPHPAGSVRVTVAHLRTRLSQVSGKPGTRIIETVRGIGYRLVG